MDSYNKTIESHPPLKAYGHFLKKSGKSDATVESYGRDARQFLEFLDARKLEFKTTEIRDLYDYSNDTLSGSTNSKRRAIFGIRQFFRFMHKTGLIQSNPLDAYCLPQRDESLAKVLVEKEVDAIEEHLRAQGFELKRNRDIAILNLLSLEGLKTNEIILLQWQDFIDGEKPSLQIRGSKKRHIQPHPQTCLSLDHYRISLSDQASPFIFISFKGKHAHSIQHQMTRHGLKHLISEAGDNAGIERLTSESLRQYAIFQMILSGLSIEEIMGHLGLKRPGIITKLYKFMDEQQSAQP